MAESRRQRKIALAARRRLSADEKKRASRRACARLARSAVFRRARHIGLYQPLASEADPRDLIAKACSWQTFYWPRVVGPLVRYVVDAGTNQRYATSTLGMAEPVGGRGVALAVLDLMVIPLVAFDRCAQRIGMGGGFYDRSLAACSPARGARRPLLVGFAFDAQRVDAIEAESWDIPMDWIVTEAGVYRRAAAPR